MTTQNTNNEIEEKPNPNIKAPYFPWRSQGIFPLSKEQYEENKKHGYFGRWGGEKQD